MEIGDYWTKLPTFNSPIIIQCTCVIIHVKFEGQAMIAKWLCYSEENCLTKVILPSKLNLLSECQLQQANDQTVIKKSVGDNATTSGIGNKRCH